MVDCEQMTGPARSNPFQWVLIALVRVYQATLSHWLGGQCKYLPTCSNYFIEAVRKRGAAVGGLLGIWRILRCHPFSKGGYDPVPEKPGKKSRAGD